MLGVELIEARRATRPTDGATGWLVRVMFFKRWEMAGSLMDGSSVWKSDTHIDHRLNRVYWDEAFGTGIAPFEPETQAVFNAVILRSPPGTAPHG